MKVIAKYLAMEQPPLLQLWVHDAPHRRMHVRVIQEYRRAILAACQKAGIITPIADPIELDVLFVNPSSPDLGNLYLALEQALDAKALRPMPGVVVDDSLIEAVKMAKYWNQAKKK